MHEKSAEVANCCECELTMLAKQGIIERTKTNVASGHFWHSANVRIAENAVQSIGLRSGLLGEEGLLITHLPKARIPV